METLPKQTSLFTEEELTSSRVVFPVRTHQLPNKTAKVNRGYKVAEQDFLGKCSAPLKKSDRATSWPKTWQIFLRLTEGQTLEQHSPNLPDWGIMQNGEFAVLQKSVRPITAPGCIWLLTPTASECNRDKLSYPMFTRRHHRSPGGLSEQLYRLFGAVPGILNPQFYAWMMGYPENWLGSNSTDTETP